MTVSEWSGAVEMDEKVSKLDADAGDRDTASKRISSGQQSAGAGPPTSRTTPPHRQAPRIAKSSSSQGSGISVRRSENVDLEKAGHIGPTKVHSRSAQLETRQLHGHTRSPGSAETTTRLTYEEDEVLDDGRDIQRPKALQLLGFLSGPCVLLSIMNATWAFLAIIVTLLSQPVRICAKRMTIGQQMSSLLAPTLNLQLRCIYAPFASDAVEEESCNGGMLLLGHLLSPFLSFAMMFAAWILAIYWVSSACIGDPAGQDKQDDGRETVLALTKWWERWLMKGVGP